MIPKTINYFWFGHKDKPESVARCIDTWHCKMPGYKIIEWNEDNFDINCCKYVSQAYKAGKYAFVSDYARLYILYNYGGIYFDTDIEVINSFDDLLENRKMVLGFEDNHYVLTAFMAAEPNLSCVKDLLDEYERKVFITDNGKMDTLPNPVIVTKYMEKYGMKANGNRQTFGDGYEIYPVEVFSAYNIAFQRIEKDSTTRLIHHCMGSWQTRRDKVKPFIKSILVRVFGLEKFEKIKSCFRGNK